MPHLTYLESENHWIQHRTWTRIGDTHPRPSPLANQFALSELQIPPYTARAAYRSWLWREMQNEYNVVWREMSDLANAAEDEQEVEILVPNGALHGDVIVRALEWMLVNTQRPRVPPRISTEPRGWFAGDITDGVISTPAEIDAEQLVWITGNTQSRIGMILSEQRAWVPDYGVVPLRESRRIDERLVARPEFQGAINDQLDIAFEAEMANSKLEYEGGTEQRPEERFDQDGAWFWEDVGEGRRDFVADALAEQVDDRLVAQLGPDPVDMATAQTFAALPELEDWVPQLPERPSWAAAHAVRPAYFSNVDRNQPLRILTVADQINGQWIRPAQKAEVMAYIRVFGRAEAHNR